MPNPTAPYVPKPGDWARSDFPLCNGEVRAILKLDYGFKFWLFGQGDEFSWLWTPNLSVYFTFISR